MRKAVILAAGRGTRMGELTEQVPKPMLRVNDKPLLEHVLDRLRIAGVKQAAIVVGYRAEVIRGHFRDYPLGIEFLMQATPNGTARAASLASEFTGDDPFLLTFGDIITEPADYTGIANVLESEPECEVVVGVKWAEDPYQGAAVYDERGRVTRIVEKPERGTSTTNWNSAGLYAVRPALFAELERVPLSPRGEYELTSAISQLVDRGSVVRMYAMKGSWRDVGRPEDLEAAKELT